MIEKDLGMMVYYVKEDKKTKKGDILLKTIKAVKKFDKYKDRRFIFGIVTSVGRTFYIQCMSEIILFINLFNACILMWVDSLDSWYQFYNNI